MNLSFTTRGWLGYGWDGFCRVASDYGFKGIEPSSGRDAGADGPLYPGNCAGDPASAPGTRPLHPLHGHLREHRRPGRAGGKRRSRHRRYRKLRRFKHPLSAPHRRSGRGTDAGGGGRDRAALPGEALTPGGERGGHAAAGDLRPLRRHLPAAADAGELRRGPPGRPLGHAASLPPV